MSRSNSPPSRKGSITFSDKDEVFEDKGGGGGGGAFSDLGDTGPKASPPKADGPQASSTPEKGKGGTGPQLDLSTVTPPAKKHSLGQSALDWLTLTYSPTPYTFRAPTRVKQLKKIMAKCPPYYLQLDHALAVIWIIFSNEGGPSLGVAQLQWALTFLLGIYTRKGDHPKDVALCIETIEDLLMQRYADMVQEVSQLEEDDRKKRRRRMLSLGSESSLRSKASLCDSETCLGRLSLDIDREIVEEGEVLFKQVPFSVNYTEMTEKAGTDVDHLYAQSKHSKISAQGSGLDLDLPQENTMEFLKQWRRDQIYKIQSELKRLHSIETYIGCAETNFDHLDQKQIDSLLGSDETATKKKGGKK